MWLHDDMGVHSYNYKWTCTSIIGNIFSRFSYFKNHLWLQQISNLNLKRNSVKKIPCCILQLHSKKSHGIKQFFFTWNLSDASYVYCIVVSNSNTFSWARATIQFLRRAMVSLVSLATGPAPCPPGVTLPFPVAGVWNLICGCWWSSDTWGLIQT